MHVTQGTDATTVAIGNERATNPAEAIRLLTRFLAGVCDGARTRDGVGFNGAHAEFGRRMATTPIEQWTPRQTWAMRRILETYKNTQLAAFWDAIPDIPEPFDARPLVSSSGALVPQPSVKRGWRVLTYARDGGMFDPNFRGMDVLVLDQNYDPGLIAKIKELPGRRYNGNNKVWVVPCTSTTVIDTVVQFGCEHGYDITDDTHEALRDKLVAARETIAASHADETTYEITGLPDGLSLYPFQRAGVEFAVKRKRVLNGDAMGLGKTPQALVTAFVTNAYPLLVICPASLKENWAREARKWTPDKTVAIMSSGSHMITDDGAPVADVVIMNYDIIKAFSMELGIAKWGMIVCDECHKLKNETSQRHLGVSLLLSFNKQARVMFLSGTPVVNKPMEFWSLIKLLGYGPEFGGMKAYKYRYDTYYRPRLEELSQRAREKFFIRRTKAQVLTELPAKTRDIVPIALSNRKEYDEVESDLAHFMATLAVQSETFDPTEAFREIARLGVGLDEARNLLLAAEKRWSEGIYRGKYDVVSRNEQLLRWEQLKKLAVDGKMKGVFEWLDEFLEGTDEKIVVFVWHVETGKQIARRYGADFIYGGMPTTQRQPAVDRFTEQPERRIIVGNIQAAGEGLNLQVANNVAFVEYGWNPKDHEQAEDRCHRMGQRDNVTAWYLAAPRTIDEEIASIIAKKLEVVDAIQDGAGRDAQMDMIGELTQRIGKRR